MIRDREFGFLLEEVKVVLKTTIPEIKLGSIELNESSEGASLQLPRWIAFELQKAGFAEILEDPLYTELLRSLSRERIQSTSSLSSLKVDLYQRIRRLYLMDRSEKKENEEISSKTSSMARDLVDIRLMKLLRLAIAQTTELNGRLTPEEVKLTRLLSSIVQEWRTNLLGG